MDTLVQVIDWMMIIMMMMMMIIIIVRIIQNTFYATFSDVADLTGNKYDISGGSKDHFPEL